ncbi:hypothetical protein [Streptomyces sp. NPDC088183]|uniref:hypothetical protein n=1 Tax=Streptomyces sp. NPDC088183 TaxID=3160992 RepID=UPI0034404352
MEVRLRKTVVKLKKTIASKNKELDQLRIDVLGLVRVVNQLTLENQQLRETLAQPAPNVVAFRNRHSPQSDE